MGEVSGDGREVTYREGTDPISLNFKERQARFHTIREGSYKNVEEKRSRINSMVLDWN